MRIKTDTEFSLIQRYLSPLAAEEEISQSFRDDAAYVTLSENEKLVISVDNYVEDRHFFMPPHMSYYQIAKRTLSCALSDLAAKAAQPFLYFMSLSLHDKDIENSLGEFCNGLKTLQDTYNIKLAGGDFTAANKNIHVNYTVLGTIPKNVMCLRKGAQIHDRIFVTGTIGEAYLGLQTMQNKIHASTDEKKQWVNAFLQPVPQFAYQDIIRQFATASMDISDGLLQDCQKLLKSSSVGADLYLDHIPLEKTTRNYVMKNMIRDSYPNILLPLVTGGDDYQILFTVGKDAIKDIKNYCTKHKNIIITEIGRVKDGPVELTLFYEGKEIDYSSINLGFSHFT